MAEMVRLARIDGLKRSIFLEKGAIEKVNRAAGSEILDAIGTTRNRRRSGARRHS